MGMTFAGMISKTVVCDDAGRYLPLLYFKVCSQTTVFVGVFSLGSVQSSTAFASPLNLVVNEI